MDQPGGCLVQRDHRADEDREHHTEPGPPLTTRRTKKESNTQRHRGKPVAVVVDQICEERDTSRQHEDRSLDDRRNSQDEKADRDGPDAVSGADDRPIYESMRMPVRLSFVLTLVRVEVRPLGLARCGVTHPNQRTERPWGALIRSSCKSSGSGT